MSGNGDTNPFTVRLSHKKTNGRGRHSLREERGQTRISRRTRYPLVRRRKITNLVENVNGIFAIRLAFERASQSHPHPAGTRSSHPCMRVATFLDSWDLRVFLYEIPNMHTPFEYAEVIARIVAIELGFQPLDHFARRWLLTCFRFFHFALRNDQ